MVYLTPKDLASRYQVTERHITALASQGILPGFKVRKLWRFDPDRIKAWEQEQQGFVPDELSRRVDEILDIHD